LTNFLIYFNIYINILIDIQIVTAQEIWKGVTTVSNTDRRRGGGKGASKKIAKDLNKGQMIDIGKKNVIFGPDLTPLYLKDEKSSKGKNWCWL
jgi:hypothetical protein